MDPLDAEGAFDDCQVVDPLTEPPPLPVRTSLDPALVIGHAVPHRVVPQLLRPLVAAFAAARDFELKTAADATACISALKIDSPEDFALALRCVAAVPLPQLQSITVSRCFRACRTEHLAEHLAPLERGVFSELHTIDLTECVRITDDALKYVAAVPQLTALNLAECSRLTEACLPHIAKMTTLEVLDLTEISSIELLRVASSGTCTGVDTLAPLQRLRALRIDARRIMPQGIAALCCFPALQELVLGETELPPDALQHFAPLRDRLRRLVFLNARDDRGAPILRHDPVPIFWTLKDLSVPWCTPELSRHCPALKELNLRGRQKFTAEDIAALSQSLALETLELLWAAVTPAVVVAVSRLVNLTTLSMVLKRAPSCLAELAQLPRLRKLTIHAPTPTDRPHFEHMRTLEDLHVHGFDTRVEAVDELFSAVSLVPRLRILRVGFVQDATSIGAAPLRPLLRCATLVSLTLGCVAAVGAFGVLAQFERLEHLSVSLSDAFSKGVAEQLRRMPQLRKIELAGDADVFALRQALPHVIVVSGRG